MCLPTARSPRRSRRLLATRIEQASAPIPTATGQVGHGTAPTYYARPNPRIFPRADVWEDSWDASINVSWTFWDGGRRRAEQAEAAAAATGS